MARVRGPVDFKKRSSKQSSKSISKIKLVTAIISIILK